VAFLAGGTVAIEAVGFYLVAYTVSILAAIPQFKATAKLGDFLAARLSQSF
jgi:hypothetical protein